jgi:hypothetical protein
VGETDARREKNPEVEQVERSAASTKVVFGKSKLNPREQAEEKNNWSGGRETR